MWCRVYHHSPRKCCPLFKFRRRFRCTSISIIPRFPIIKRNLTWNRKLLGRRKRIFCPAYTQSSEMPTLTWETFFPKTSSAHTQPRRHIHTQCIFHISFQTLETTMGLSINTTTSKYAWQMSLIITIHQGIHSTQIVTLTKTTQSTSPTVSSFTVLKQILPMFDKNTHTQNILKLKVVFSPRMNLPSSL